MHVTPAAVLLLLAVDTKTYRITRVLLHSVFLLHVLESPLQLENALLSKLAWHPAASLEVSPPTDVTYLWPMLDIPRQAESDGNLHLQVIIRINLHSVLVLVQNHEG
jgi:hypothetical protein